jgi:hypothetical protein
MPDTVNFALGPAPFSFGADARSRAWEMCSNLAIRREQIEAQVREMWRHDFPDEATPEAFARLPGKRHAMYLASAVILSAFGETSFDPASEPAPAALN